MQCFFFSFFFLRYHEQSTNTMSFPYIYLLGVTTLDITQLETREQVWILEIKVTQIPEIIENF